MSESTAIEMPKRKRNPDDGELDITPMIDVTFLLLAFFLVVSQMDPQAAVQLPMASYGASIPDKNCVTLILVLDKETGEIPEIYLGRAMSKDSMVQPGEEDDQKQQIADYVENELTTFPTKSAILIKAAGSCKTGMVELVKKGVAQSELALARKVYVGIEEEQ